MPTDLFTLAYLAGAMDADGYFTIKRSRSATFRARGWTEMFTEVVGLKQVTPQVPQLLHGTFGGSLYLQQSSAKRGRPLHIWHGSNTVALACCHALLPYLRIKGQQAQKLIELSETKASRYRRLAYWFEREFPDWRSLPMVTIREAGILLGRDPTTARRCILGHVSQSDWLRLPFDYHNPKAGRIPRLFAERLAALLASDGRKYHNPPELIAWRSRICGELRELNRVGVGEIADVGG